MSRDLDHLCPRFRGLAFELIARCAERKVWLVIIDTLRTPTEQAKYLESGASKTLNSLHLPQTWCLVCGHAGGLSHAMDAAPIRDLDENVVKQVQWDAGHPSWKAYGAAAKSLGLVWGGDWGWDFSHVQVPRTRYDSAKPDLSRVIEGGPV